jgi:adenosylcobinamide kinase/adenosylcobinamide-phosphate guanylyltransferase
MAEPRLTLVIGGARSGKRRHAEALVTGGPAPWPYLATAEVPERRDAPPPPAGSLR